MDNDLNYMFHNIPSSFDTQTHFLYYYINICLLKYDQSLRTRWKTKHNHHSCPTSHYRSVFIMYCANCARDYNSEGSHVGYGATTYGVEIVIGDVNNSAWKTYLKD